MSLSPTDPAIQTTHRGQIHQYNHYSCPPNELLLKDCTSDIINQALMTQDACCHVHLLHCYCWQQKIRDVENTALITSGQDIHIYFKNRAAWLTRLLMLACFLSGCTVCCLQHSKWTKDYGLCWNVKAIPEDSEPLRFDGSVGVIAEGKVSVHILIISA